MSSERWIEVQDDGRLIMYRENDGWTYMRHGPEREHWEVKLNRKNAGFDAMEGTSSWYSYGCLLDAVRGLVRLGLMSFDEGVDLLSRDRSFVYSVTCKYNQRKKELEDKLDAYSRARAG